MALFANDVILYLENIKNSVRITHFSIIAIYIVNTQKTILFFYTNNKLTKKEFVRAIIFTVKSRKMKYIAIIFIIFSSWGQNIVRNTYFIEFAQDLVYSHVTSKHGDVTK